MGNRAVITTYNHKDNTPSLYLHWNGGRDSVEAFLMYAKLKGHRPMESDSYGIARLAQIIGNFFGGTNSLGIDNYSNCDTNNFDNGVYLVKDWEIVDREFFSGVEQREHDLGGMLLGIDEKQPEHLQLGKDGIQKALNKFDLDNKKAREEIMNKYYETLKKNGQAYMSFVDTGEKIEARIKKEFQVSFEEAKEYINNNK